MQGDTAISKKAEDFRNVRHRSAWEVTCVGDNDPIDGIEAGDQTVPVRIFATTGDPSVILESGHHHVAAIFDRAPEGMWKFC